MLNYAIFVLTTAGIYAVLAQSLMLSWGMGGIVNLGLAGFFAIGAYASAMATKWGGLPLPVGLVLAMLAASVAGLVVTFSTLRLRDDYLAIVTLGFAEVLRIVANNEIWLTGGSDGISGITGGLSRADRMPFALTWLGVVTLVVIVWLAALRRLAASPWGRALRAVRDDQVVAAVAGKPVTRFKAQAFALSTAIAGLAGALFGHFGSYVAPDMFQPLITIYIFLAVTLGGNGRPSGAVLGAYVLVPFLELTRFIAEHVGGISALQGAALREIIVAVVLLVLMRLRPRGLLPERNQQAPRPSSPSERSAS
ncbi:MAG TPA: branched-chain amino acid ABC transporter permease [Ramlibacter sp.]|nr:branched-chain amino acid ABC transporter permease [Ramlibacter sp.]